jgi:hypothetical protein
LAGLPSLSDVPVMPVLLWRMNGQLKSKICG